MAAFGAGAGVEHDVHERGQAGSERLPQCGGQLSGGRGVVAGAAEGLDEPVVMGGRIQHRGRGVAEALLTSSPR